jgi:hypothetical protein
MNARPGIIPFLLLLIPFGIAGADQVQVMENYGAIPLAFTRNQGQADPWKKLGKESLISVIGWPSAESKPA